MRRELNIAIAGLACENSTFTPSRTQAAAFRPKRGNEIIQSCAFLKKGSRLHGAAKWHGALTGHALPGGRVSHEAFEQLAEELLSRLKAIVDSTKLDGLWYDIHGAMFVDGHEDVEAELLHRIRAVIGPDVVVSASMDLHGNVSRQLAHQVDLITCYRTAPHVDVVETRERACSNLVKVLTESPRNASRTAQPVLPVKAWIPLPILLPGEQTSTRLEPAKHIYANIAESEKAQGVLDAAIWVGYAWGDEARNRAIVMVTGEDATVVGSECERLAGLFWRAHQDFKFVAKTGSFDECFDAAVASTDRPYYISDSGDNPTAGGSGDVTWTLQQLLRRSEVAGISGPRVIYASIPCREIHKCVEAGIGAEVSVTAGAEVDNIHAGPITLKGRVHAIKHGDPYAKLEAVLQVGSVFVILTEDRKPYHRERDFSDLSLDARAGADIVLVKIGYLEPELYDMAADWMLALTPGGVDQDLPRLGHKYIRRPCWPFDKSFPRGPPDLSARFIPAAHEPLTGPDE